MDDGPDSISRLYNSRNIQVWIRFLEKRYPDVSIGRILDYAGMKSYEVNDDGHWFTQSQIDRFYEKTVQLTRNLTIAREAGRFATAVETKSMIRRYMLGFLGPQQAYAMLDRSSALITRSSKFKVRKIDSNSVEIVVTPLPGVMEKPYQCENRTGIIESIALAFTHHLPKIDHRECIFRGDKSCRYLIRWEANSLVPLRMLRNSFAAAAILLGAGSLPLLSFSNWLIFSLSLLSSNLLLSFLAKNRENHHMMKTLDELRQSTEELALQTRINYNNTTVSHEVGEAISKYTNIDEVLSNVAQIFEKLLNYDRGVIMLSNEDGSRLEFRAGFGYSREHLALLKDTMFHLDKKGSRGVFVLSYRERRSFLVNDLNEIEKDLSARSLAFARSTGTRSFICCPIVCEEESLGILAVDNVQSKQPLLSSDLNMLRGIASVIGMSIKNARLIESREEQFKSIIKVLATSIDARDNLTAGHSEKVTEYALGISRELGLSKDFQEMIRIAALLHDYGKIGVPDSILKKQGELSPVEYAEIKTHAAKTHAILSQIAFDGIYTQVPKIASSHHERLDGKGYPNGLKGNEIPLGARIIAVADFYDAITSQRHYRQPMLADDALELLMREADHHLDRRVIIAFFLYLQKNDLVQHVPDFIERLA
ncbi:HD domain-containing phosphohydrolase [Marispirochaeta aestuarii]|uniref:HD-GYP domain-containing protein n=1 Tax=Marispirochaeta aestuarii TaxID=1963862 RepID=UPI0029C923CD|nr:HD domain-containing phosphohydrolase [Marispirochaeta aestuarii]